jgi:acetyl-CoA carboxylase/biotin carboxylase 1
VHPPHAQVRQTVVFLPFRLTQLFSFCRIDPVLLELKQGGVFSPSSAITATIKSREKALMPVYHQVARTFADMHDTPIRMLAKGVIRSIVPWSESRSFFSTRLKRRLMEETLASHVQSTDGNISSLEALNMIRGWYQHANLSNAYDDGKLSFEKSAEDKSFLVQNREDIAFLSWAEGSNGRSLVASELKALRARAASRTVSQVLATPEGKEGLLKSLQVAAKRDASWMLQLRMMLNESNV